MATFKPTHGVAPRVPKPPGHEGHSHRKVCPNAFPDSGLTCWAYIDVMQTLDERIGGGP